MGIVIGVCFSFHRVWTKGNKDRCELLSTGDAAKPKERTHFLYFRSMSSGSLTCNFQMRAIA